jgi:O-antigen/teichoic acid export membrane protein
LIPSALAGDVGPRASGRFAGLAMAQAVRALGLAIGVAWLVASPGDASIAAASVVMAEVASSGVLLRLYRREHGWIRPRFRRRAWSVLARRGAVAGACRFARVGLYAGDLLILGALATTTLGPYAAARRVAFALLALGLVVPSAVAPRIARAWASGTLEARSVIARTLTGMMLLALPATVGLIATSDRWMPMLFGEGFREGGPWLALIAARLPFVLASNVQQSALIACRREGLAMRLMLGMLVLGVVALPPLAGFQGAWGVAWGVLGVEVLGAVGGWLALRSLGVAPPWHHASGPALAGCLGLMIVCSIGRDWPLVGVVIAGAGVYASLTFLLLRGWPLAFSSSPLPLGEGPGVRGIASPPARIEGIIVDHPTRHDPHPGPLPKGEGGRGKALALAGGGRTS